jgi:hypothetical protein
VYPPTAKPTKKLSSETSVTATLVSNHHCLLELNCQTSFEATPLSSPAAGALSPILNHPPAYSGRINPEPVIVVSKS